MLVGYTAGVYDLFHVGHVNLLASAKKHCDFLIVGVTTDELAMSAKGRCVIPFEERCKVLEAVKYVDKVVEQETFDKYDAWLKFHFDVIFVGDDWQGSPTWKVYEEKFKEVGVKVIYFPYTRSTSSTLINETLEKLRVKPS